MSNACVMVYTMYMRTDGKAACSKQSTLAATQTHPHISVLIFTSPMYIFTYAPTCRMHNALLVNMLPAHVACLKSVVNLFC